MCHTRTQDLAGECRRAEILLTTAGKAGLIGAGCVSPGQVVIDVGINVGPDGKLCGDVDFPQAGHRLRHHPGARRRRRGDHRGAVQAPDPGGGKPQPAPRLIPRPGGPRPGGLAPARQRRRGSARRGSAPARQRPGAAAPWRGSARQQRPAQRLARQRPRRGSAATARQRPGAAQQRGPPEHMFRRPPLPRRVICGNRYQAGGRLTVYGGDRMRALPGLTPSTTPPAKQPLCRWRFPAPW